MEESERRYRSTELVPIERDFNFLMRNGFTKGETGAWVFNQDILKQRAGQLRGLRTSMFGPSVGDNIPFFGINEQEFGPFASAFIQQPVLEAISKYRSTDGKQAGRISYILGGIVRESLSYSDQYEIKQYVKFIANMTKLGEHKSGDAIAAAMAMYVISGGPIEDDPEFAGHIYHMADAIHEDPIVPRETADLGLSQVIRLRSFIDKLGNERRPFPDISKDIENFSDFPTVGAEFHFPSDAPDKIPKLWQRLAILNISQHQLGNYVQFSRDDRGIIEVRMNPSVYPVAIALWNHMRFIMPELNEAHFTATFNRNGEEDFSWDKLGDQSLLKKLRGLGLLSYATVFKNIPHQKTFDEINFGSVYLGQTVKMDQGSFKFTGQWAGKEGKSGQLGIYAGYGNNLPYLAYFPSMALANPEILDNVDDELARIHTLHDALRMTPIDRIEIFEDIQANIEFDSRLNKASRAGMRIIERLTP